MFGSKKIYFKAMRTCSTVKKIISKRSKDIYIKEFKLKVKRTRSIFRKFISKRSEHVYFKEFKYLSEAKQFNIKL